MIWYDPVITAGSKSFITDVICGCRSTIGYRRYGPGVAPNQPGGSAAPVTRLHPAGPRRPWGDCREELKAHAGWDQLAAVRDNHVIYMGERLFHPSPVVFDALEQLAKQLHPEAFQTRRDNP